MTDEAFRNLFAQVRLRTPLERIRLQNIYELAKNIEPVKGDVAEVGVYRGAVSKILASVLVKKQLHLFDTFRGIPTVDPSIDKHHEGDYGKTSLAEVKEFLKDHNNISYYQGVFPETAGAVEKKKFSLVIIDVDIYKSGKDCLEFFYPRLVRGGYLILDDYGRKACAGMQKAGDEYFPPNPFENKRVDIVSYQNYQLIMKKKRK